MTEKLDYLIASFDFFLGEGMSPQEAWMTTLDAYAYVYHTDDGRLPLALASEALLPYLNAMGAEGVGE